MMRFTNHIGAIILSVLLLLILQMPGMGQGDQATLRILVISQDDGTPVIGATVFLSEPDADTLRAGVTNTDGYAEFSRMAAGPVQVHVSFIGFETHRQIITLQPGQIRIYRPELARATEQLDEVQVRAAAGAVRREAGRQTITGEQIGRIPSPGPAGDLTAYLQILPGVVTVGDRGGELFIRGGTPAQNLILVDNIPVVKPFHISNLFSAIPQQAVSSVDLYAGGFGAEYSGATSAVLDINLRQGNMRRFETEAAASPYMISFRAEGPLQNDRQSLLLVARTSILEQTGPTLVGQDVPWLFYDLTGRYSVNWPGMVCSLTGLHTYDRGRINPDRAIGLTWSNSALGTRCLGFSEAIDHAFDFSLGYSKYSNSESGFDDVVRRSDVQRGFLRVDINWDHLDFAIHYGARIDFIRYKALLEDPFVIRRESGERYTGLDSTLDELISIFGGYATFTWQPSAKFRIVSGLVSQVRLSTVDPTIEPRIRAVWRPDGSDRHEVSIAAGRYLQVYEAISDERDAGTVFYVYKPSEIVDPLPESLHGILGYRRQIGQYAEASLEGYVKHHRHLPVAVWTREPSNTLSTAQADGVTWGADLQVEVNRYPFYFLLGYGLSKVTYEADANDLVAWIDRPVFRYNPSHDRRHQINLVSSVQFSGFTANATWQFSSGNPYTQLFALDMLLDVSRQHPLTDRGRVVSLYSEPFNGRFPSFHRLDVSLSRLFRVAAGFTLEAELGAVNAYNVQNIFYFDVNTLQQVDELPFMPYLSLSARLR